MAERKRISPVKARDHDFIARVEGRGQKHADSFAIIQDGHPSDPPPARNSEKQPATSKSAIPPVEKEVTARPSKAPKPRIKPTSNKAVKATGAKVSIYLGISADLYERSEKWATAAKCPPKRIAIAALEKLRPKLVEELPNIDLGSLSTETSQNLRDRINTSLMVDQVVLDELEEKFNPHGFNSIPAMISRWVRKEFYVHYDAYLSHAGY